MGIYRIDPSPPKTRIPLPTSPRKVTPPRSPPRINGGSGSVATGKPAVPSQRSSFLPINVPTQPRSSIPQTRPVAASQFGGESNRAIHQQSVEEPVALIEEERDPEQILEERRKKREEIMTRFAGKKVQSTVTATSGTIPQVDSGLDSVGSGGMRTAARTGVTTATGK